MERLPRPLSPAHLYKKDHPGKSLDDASEEVKKLYQEKYQTALQTFQDWERMTQAINRTMAPMPRPLPPQKFFKRAHPSWDWNGLLPEEKKLYKTKYDNDMEKYRQYMGSVESDENSEEE